MVFCLFVVWTFFTFPFFVCLYDRHKISGGSSSNSNLSRTTSNSSTQTISTRIDLKLDDNGVITFYRDGNIIEDQSLIRKIKSTPEFKA